MSQISLSPFGFDGKEEVSDRHIINEKNIELDDTIDITDTSIDDEKVKDETIPKSLFQFKPSMLKKVGSWAYNF